MRDEGQIMGGPINGDAGEGAETISTKCAARKFWTPPVPDDVENAILSVG